MSSCSKCGKICKDKRGLAIHEARCGIIKEEKRYVCEYCDLEVKNNDNLQRHLNVCKKKKDKEVEDKKQEITVSYQTQINDLHREYERRLMTEQDLYRREKEWNNTINKSNIERITMLEKQVRQLEQELKEERQRSESNKREAFLLAEKALEKTLR